MSHLENEIHKVLIQWTEAELVKKKYISIRYVKIYHKDLKHHTFHITVGAVAVRLTLYANCHAFNPRMDQISLYCQQIVVLGLGVCACGIYYTHTTIQEKS